MAHTNIDAKTRKRAKALRSDMTRAETVMWDVLREFRPRGARFRRETPIGPYIVDFAWLSARIVVEVDGDSHETPKGKMHDLRRDRWLEGQGFRVLRFDNQDVLEAEDGVWAEIEAAIGGYLHEQK